MQSMAFFNPWQAAGKLFCVLAIAASVLCGCTVPYMQVDSRLAAAAPALPVEGRQGWLVNQQLRFGSFTSGPVKRSWTTGYNIPFIVRFSGAKEKLGFSMSGARPDQAEVFCLGKLSERDLPVLNRSFEVSLKTTDVFSCAIAMGGESFEFYSENLNENPRFDAPVGQLRGPGLELTIQAVTSLESGDASWSTRPLGFELLLDGRVVLAVETLNDGRVWIDPSLPDRDQLLAASVAAALLLRSSLSEHNDDLL